MIAWLVKQNKTKTKKRAFIKIESLSCSGIIRGKDVTLRLIA